MDYEKITSDRIKATGLLPLFYHDAPTACLSVAHALYNAGIRCIEFTNRGEMAIRNFTALVKERNENMPDLLLGIGTVKTDEQASKFVDAGADFLVSPFFDSSVCDIAYLNKKMWIPGCMTPAEIHIAAQAGCTMIKIFPGNVLGPSFIEAVKPIFPALDFLVTGGVDSTMQNLERWFNAGVCAVGIGGKLISTDVLNNNDFAGLEKQAKQLAVNIAQIKSNKRSL